jgi:caspase domain-containing protein/Sel1 repeat-containing protein
VRLNGKVALIALLLAATCASTDVQAPAGAQALKRPPTKADDVLIVVCKLPPRLVGVGMMRRMVPGPIIKTDGRDCEIRGGTWVAYDRADYKTALEVWREQADKGDPEALTYIGEIHERGLGLPAPDYAAAAEWYRKAASAGSKRAAINLGRLYEHGLGVPRDSVEALNWYRRGTGSGVSLVYDRPSEPAGTAPPPGSPPAGTPARPPVIDVAQPDVAQPITTRDIKVAATTPVAIHSGPAGEIALVASVTADNPLKSVTVNGREQIGDGPMRGPRSVFQTRLPLRGAEEQVEIVAADTAGLTSRVKFVVLNRAVGGRPESPSQLPRPETPGRYVALIIGNDDYRAPVRRLQTAVNDAVEVARLLEDNYGFTVIRRLNANRFQMMSALYEAGEQLSDNDNLLIYYAGHGVLDQVNNRGHWLPVDADDRNPANWISNISVTDVLNNMRVRRLLVVADSCYSGTLTRSNIARVVPGMTGDERAQAIRTMTANKAYVALTSGGLEPVVDAAGGRHSPFAQSFLDILRGNTGVLSTQELFVQLKPRVVTMTKELKVAQVPQYGPIQYTDHQAGDFIFVRKP